MDLFQLKRQFNDHNILICFNGPFTHSILEEIGIAIRNHLNNENLTKAAITDVFSVYIELTQNARNYILTRDLPPGEPSSTIVVVARNGESYSVTSGNYVLKEDVPALVEKIDHINGLKAEEVKQLYRSQIRNTPADGARGAGLGLLEIARKSSSHMKHLVRETDGPYSFFSLTAFV